MRVFLGSNPTREREEDSGRRSSHSPGHSLRPLLILCPPLSLGLSLSLSPPICPLLSSLPLSFFRHEPCVIKQLGGAAEREREVMARWREKKEMRDRKRKSRSGKKGSDRVICQFCPVTLNVRVSLYWTM